MVEPRTGNNCIQTASCNECAAHDWYQPLCLGDRDVFAIKHDLKRHAGARQRDKETVNAHYERLSSSQVHPHIQLIFSTPRELIVIATNIEHYRCLCVFPRAATPCAAALSSTGQRTHVFRLRDLAVDAAFQVRCRSNAVMWLFCRVVDEKTCQPDGH